MHGTSGLEQCQRLQTTIKVFLGPESNYSVVSVPDSAPEALSGHKIVTKRSVKKSPLRAPKRLWTEQEDIELDKGFKLYGFQWNLMLKDPALNFDQRSCGQIRDRFRLRFPSIYKQQDPAALPKENRTPPKKTQPVKSSLQTMKTMETVDDSTEPLNDEEIDVGTRDKTSSKMVLASHTEDEDNRLSNSILRNDWDWDENLTLAPLAWEDMATSRFPFE